MNDAPAATWQPVKRLRTHEQVLAAVEDQIVRGHLRAGHRLPGERDLAIMLGVSRPSVREALRVLEWMGVVVDGSGAGRESGSVVTSSPSEAMTRLLRVHLALANFSLEDVVSSRVLLEAAAARGATRHASPSDLARLAQVLRAMDPDDDALEPHLFAGLDTDFHVAIAKASGNRLIAVLMHSLRDALQRQMADAFDRLTDWRETAAELHVEHRAIHAAIASRDGDAAAAAIETHIERFYSDARVVT
jgi:GntR family transcriptional repressor for pyruvate dehydrogenase complex